MGSKDADLIAPFYLTPVNRRSMVPAFSISLVLHLVLVYVGGSYLRFVREMDRVEQRQWRTRVVELATPYDLLRHERIEHPRPRFVTKPSPEMPERTAPLPAVARETVLQAVQNLLPRRQFEPPAAKRRQAEVADVLLQPDTPIVSSVDHLAVPSVVILNKVLAGQRQFVRPPPRERVQTLPEQPVLDAAAPMLGDSAIAATKLNPLDRIPVLPVPSGVPSTVSGSSGKQAQATVASVSGAGSDGVALISLPSRPVPYTPSFSVPAVSVLGGASGGAGGTAHTAVSVEGSARSGMGMPSAPGSSTAAGGTGTADVAGRSGAGKATGGTAAAGSANGPGEPGAGLAAGGPRVPDGVIGAPELVRILRPLDGKQDFVVTQVASSIPGSAGLLTGRPVYTVYVPVGSGKEWILQYCVPSQKTDAPARRNTVVLELKPANPVAAPYAFVLFRPGLHFKSGARYAFVHGFINERGRFEGLKETGQTALEEVDSVLRALGQWEFRPASRDGVPISVEVLICIPSGVA